MKDEFKYYKHVIVAVLSCIIGAILTGALELTGEPSSWVGAISTMFAAIGTVGTLIFIIIQHSQTLSREKIEDESKLALDTFLATTQRLLDRLSNKTTNKLSTFSCIESTYDNLREIQDQITLEHHKVFARVRYRELRDELEMFASNLHFRDLFKIEQSLRLKNNRASAKHLDNPNGHAEVLIEHWYDLVLPSSTLIPSRFEHPYGTISYGASVSDELLFKLVSLLTSQPLKVKKHLGCRKVIWDFKKTGRSSETHIVPFLIQKCPTLFSHLILTLSAKAYRNDKGITTVKLNIYGPEKKWLVHEYDENSLGIATYEIPQPVGINVELIPLCSEPFLRNDEAKILRIQKANGIQA